MDQEQVLKDYYYDPENPASFGGARKLHRILKKDKRKIPIKRVKDWLGAQRVYSLFKQPNRKFPRNRVLAYDLNEVWQIDLMDMGRMVLENDGYRYALVIIDVLSKQAYAVPIKTKAELDVKAAFEKLFRRVQVRPKFIHSDKGGEFTGGKIQAYFKKLKIRHYVTQNEDIKAPVVERFIRTLKGLIYRYLSHRQTYRWIDVLDKLLANYNRTWHRSIRMRPVDVKTEDDVVTAYENLYPELVDGSRVRSLKAPSRLKVGDHVRLLHKPEPFSRGFDPRWTEEVFRVARVLPRRPWQVYGVTDLNGRALTGTFYAPELQQVAPPEEFLVNEVLRERKRGKKTEYYVSWIGYGPEFNSWVTDLYHVGARR